MCFDIQNKGERDREGRGVERKRGRERREG
jgi:hypothetical protein